MQAPKSTTRTERAQRHFAPALLALLILAGVQHLLVLWQAWQINPLTRQPILDAEAYWDWAGNIAAGDWRLETPFFSAPLYPYLLGLLRILGSGLLAILVVQAAIHLGTLYLLATTARQRFGAWTGLCSGVFYLLLTEPSFFAGRVLNVSLQLFLVVWLWSRWLKAAQPEQSSSRQRFTYLLLSCAVGLNCLANPTFLMALPLFGLWIWFRHSRSQQPEAAGKWSLLAAGLAPAILVISPATLHNFAASGELISISAQGGLTFYHGNGPGAQGFYQAAEGVSASRLQQNQDAYRIAGKDSWRGTSSYFFNKGLNHWLENPGQTIQLLFKKAALFCFGHYYGDVYNPALERQDGILSRLLLAPLPTHWLSLPALLALFLLWRARRKPLPETLLLVLPWIVVILFFYSPRYRAPALPMLAVLSGWALAQILQFKAHPENKGQVSLLAAAFFFSAVLAPALRKQLDDTLEVHRFPFHISVGDALLENGDPNAALKRYRIAQQLRPGDPAAERAIGEALRRAGRGDEALAPLRKAVADTPEDPALQKTLAVALATTANNLKHQPQQSDADYAQAQSYFAEAETHYRESLRLGLDQDLEVYEGLSNVLAELQKYSQAENVAQQGLAIDPQNSGCQYALLRIAWDLATLDADDLRDGPTAVRLADQVNRRDDYQNPFHLDILAAAYAATGNFDKAVEVQTKAIQIATGQAADASPRESGASVEAGVLQAFEQRLELYRNKREFRVSGE